MTFPPPDAGCPAKTHLPGHGATEPGKDTRKSQIYLASLHPGGEPPGCTERRSRRDRAARPERSLQAGFSRIRP
ncbi:hypothetical protein DVF32_24575 [Salmonella enterica subsp. diarizonae]|nr:hypothetical protein [Salmonella enterica subsp. diarizonae]